MNGIAEGSDPSRAISVPYPGSRKGYLRGIGMMVWFKIGHTESKREICLVSLLPLLGRHLYFLSSDSSSSCLWQTFPLLLPELMRTGEW